MPPSAYLPVELVSRILDHTRPSSTEDVQAWRSHAVDLRRDYSLVNSTWHSAAADECMRHLAGDGCQSTIPSLIRRLDHDREARQPHDLQPHLEDGEAVTASNRRPEFSFILPLLSRLPYLRRIVFYRCLQLDFVQIGNLQGKSINLEELYCIESYIIDYPRLEHPGPSLRLRRLVLDSTLLPPTIPAPLLPELAHLAQINVEGRSAASFTRDAWLAGFAPQLTSCALTLVGSGWHSDLPIIRAMKQIRGLDLFIPNAVGLPVATFLGPSPIEYAIGSTIEFLRIEMTSYRFSTFVTWAQDNPPPNKLRYLGLRIQELLQEDARENLLRVWARVKIEVVVVGLPENRRCEEGYQELFWDKVERGDFDRIVATPTSLS